MFEKRNQKHNGDAQQQTEQLHDGQFEKTTLTGCRIQFGQHIDECNVHEYARYDAVHPLCRVLTVADQYAEYHADER